MTFKATLLLFFIDPQVKLSSKFLQVFYTVLAVKGCSDPLQTRIKLVRLYTSR